MPDRKSGTAQTVLGANMALHSLNVWEIALGGTQIFLCAFILLFLVRKRSRNKHLIHKAPTDKNARNFNTEFIVEAVRQQTELAFNHILETINKERYTLETYFEFEEAPSVPGFFKSITTGRNDAVSAQGPADLDAADALYKEIENLAEQGMRPIDISEKLNVPPGEVDLVLRLKHLSAESAKKDASYSSS